MSLRDAIVFLRQASGDFHNIGAVLPSSRALAKALANSIPLQDSPLRVLEIGAGTGVLTGALLHRLPKGSILDIVELNPQFASYVQEYVLSGACDIATRMLVGDFLEVDLPAPYDAVLSGLPLNNFPPEKVRSILSRAIALTAEGGTTAWFEYAHIRQIKGLFVSDTERRRLEDIGAVLAHAQSGQPHKRVLVPWNVPPAFVHRLGPVQKNGNSR